MYTNLFQILLSIIIDNQQPPISVRIDAEVAKLFGCYFFGLFCGAESKQNGLAMSSFIEFLWLRDFHYKWN